MLNVRLLLFPFSLSLYIYRLHINESSEGECLRFKDVLLSYWSYTNFHQSVEQYWCICCSSHLPSKLGAFDHLSDIKLFQLQSMYDFMYAIVSSLFADFRLEVHLDASKHKVIFLLFRNQLLRPPLPPFPPLPSPQLGVPVTFSALVPHIFLNYSLVQPRHSLSSSVKTKGRKNTSSQNLYIPKL